MHLSHTVCCCCTSSHLLTEILCLGIGLPPKEPSLLSLISRPALLWLVNCLEQVLPRGSMISCKHSCSHGNNGVGSAVQILAKLAGRFVCSLVTQNLDGKKSGMQTSRFRHFRRSRREGLPVPLTLAFLRAQKRSWHRKEGKQNEMGSLRWIVPLGAFRVCVCLFWWESRDHSCSSALTWFCSWHKHRGLVTHSAPLYDFGIKEMPSNTWNTVGGV